MAFEKKLGLLVLFLGSYFVSNAQLLSDSVDLMNNSVKWQQESNWSKIRKAAAREKRYIFRDCYASWCLPCKKMDLEVYTDDSVIKFLNAHFFSTKVRMDSLKSDGEAAKKWYSISQQLSKEYNIEGLPTLLFFSPSGYLILSETGAKDKNDFLNLCKTVLQKDTQISNLIDKYEEGTISYNELHELAIISKGINKGELSHKAAHDYINNYLYSLDDTHFFSKDNFAFIFSFKELISSSDKIFRWLFQNPNRVDTLMGQKGFSRSHINFIINKEMVRPFIDSAKAKNSEPSWKVLKSEIEAKFNADFAEENVLKEKVGWYKSKEDWKNFTKNLVLLITKMQIPEGLMGLMILNNNAFEVFLHSKKKHELKTALKWSNEVLKKSWTPNEIDTNANLLYKLGRKKKAIAREQQAIQLSPNNKQIQDALSKMKGGLPTW